MSQNLANTILQNIGDGILSIDANYKVVFANAKALSILNLDINSTINADVRQLFSLAIYDEQCNKTPVDPFKDTIESGQSQSYSIPMVVDSIKCKMVYIEDSISPIRNGDGELVGAVMVFRDVTEEVQMSTLLNITRERYENLFNSIRSGVTVYESHNGITFNIVDMNSAGEQLDWVSKKDIIGKDVEKVFPGIEKLGLLDALKRVWKTGNSERLPCSFYEDKVRKGWRDNFVYKLPSGEVVAVYDDVTSKRERAENISNAVEKLRDSETRLTSMFENSAVGIVASATPPDFSITVANKAFCDFLGYTKEEMVGKKIQDITDPDDWPISEKSIYQARGASPSGKPIQLIKRYIRKDGTTRWGSVFLSKIEYEDGHIEHFAQVVDITNQKRAEDEKTVLAKIVSELNATDVQNHDIIKEIMMEIKKFMRLDAVAVRIPEKAGSKQLVNDYPFYFHFGFSDDFVKKESSLCFKDNTGECVITSDGTSVLACMCGAVISGKTNPNMPYFTKNGSFWTVSSSELVKSFDPQQLQKIRGTCLQNGYESTAIVPIMSDLALSGSLLLNAKRKNAFDLRSVLFLEEVAKAMGVAFSRMQMRKDIEENRQSLARANGILSVECDIARGMAAGSEGGLDGVLYKAGKKLKVKYLSVTTIGNNGLLGRWVDEGGTSVASIDENIKFSANDIVDFKKWCSLKEIYSGSKDGLPPVLMKMSQNKDGHWIAIPVHGDASSSPVGVVMMIAKNERQWSKNENEVLVGLAMMLCLLAKSEKNHIDLRRKIEETIVKIGQTVGTPTLGGNNANR